MTDIDPRAEIEISHVHDVMDQDKDHLAVHIPLAEGGDGRYSDAASWARFRLQGCSLGCSSRPCSAVQKGAIKDVGPA